MSIEFTPIGVIRSPFTRREGMPIQPERSQALGRVEVDPAYVDALKDVEDFSHLILVYHFHQAPTYRPTVTPFLDDVARGLFATRHPARPNPIGLSVVRLLERRQNVLEIGDVDILDGTPLLDIKPYVPQFDHRPDARVGWLSGRADNPATARYLED